MRRTLAVLSAARAVPVYARALTVKATLPLTVAGVTLLSGAAVAAPAVIASVNSAPVASAATTGAHPNMYYA